MDFGTKKIMEEYISTLPEDGYVRRRRRSFYRNEVFEYENRIGKSVFDMNHEELLEMVSTFMGANGRRYVDKMASYDMVRSAWALLFDWYSINKKPIVNWWQQPEMKGKAAFQKLNKSGELLLDFKWLRSQIDGLYKIFPLERASYIDCLAMMFYDGISSIGELIDVKEEMIDFRKLTIQMKNRTISLSPRTLQLMIYCHGLTEMQGHRETYAMESYHGSYIPFSVRKSNLATFQDDDRVNVISTKISTLLVNNLKDRSGSSINYMAIYSLGCYDALAAKFGKDEIDVFIYDIGNSTLNIDDVAKACEQRGVSGRNFYPFKRGLYKFATPPDQKNA